MTPAPLKVVELGDQCWNRIGTRGDRSCPELTKYTQCNNCPVFAAAGRRFLDTPSPAGYLDEWTSRLAARDETREGDESSVIVFRLAEEWLALPVAVLVEVTRPRPIHRVPHRGGLLAGVANIRGELHLCVRLDLLLGVAASDAGDPEARRLVVIRRDSESWAFTADEVDQVYRVLLPDLADPAPTLARSHGKLTRGVFPQGSRSVGLLDDSRLFQSLQERLR
jgi:chemotaxis-related protein WspD